MEGRNSCNPSRLNEITSCGEIIWDVATCPKMYAKSPQKSPHFGNAIAESDHVPASRFIGEDAQKRAELITICGGNE